MPEVVGRVGSGDVGVDAGTDAGMRRIVEIAGLDWREARQKIGDTTWIGEAEANRLELMSLGLWGVVTCAT